MGVSFRAPSAECKVFSGCSQWCRSDGDGVVGGGQLKPKPAAFTELGFDPDGAAHPFDRFAHDGQSEAHPAVLTAVDALKHLEEFGLLFLKNADPVVLDPNPNLPFPRLAPDAHLGFNVRLDELYRVVQEVC